MFVDDLLKLFCMERRDANFAMNHSNSLSIVLASDTVQAAATMLQSLLLNP